MDHRTACQLLVLHQIALERDRVQHRDPRESAQQQGPGATRMELQTCWASDVSRAQSLLLENIKMVALEEPTTVVSQVQRFHVALAEKVSLELAQVTQEFLATKH